MLHTLKTPVPRQQNTKRNLPEVSKGSFEYLEIEQKSCLSSLDKFLTDLESSELSAEEKVRFEKWLSKVLSEPELISSMIEDALKKGMFSEWEEESINHKFKLGSYYPSIIERCLRQQAYSYLYAIPPSPGRARNLQ